MSGSTGPVPVGPSDPAATQSVQPSPVPTGWTRLVKVIVLVATVIMAFVTMLGNGDASGVHVVAGLIWIVIIAWEVGLVVYGDYKSLMVFIKSIFRPKRGPKPDDKPNASSDDEYPTGPIRKIGVAPANPKADEVVEMTEMPPVPPPAPAATRDPSDDEGDDRPAKNTVFGIPWKVFKQGARPTTDPTTEKE